MRHFSLALLIAFAITLSGSTKLIMGLLAAIVLALIYLASISKKRDGIDPCLVAIVGSILVYVAFMYWASIPNERARSDLLGLSLFGCSLLLGNGMKKEDGQNLLSYGLLVSILVGMTAAIWQRFFDPTFFPLPGYSRAGYAALGRGSGFYNNPNHLAYLGMVSAFWFIACSIQHWRKPAGYLWSIGAVASSYCVYLSSSRAGAVALFLGCSVGALLCFKLIQANSLKAWAITLSSALGLIIIVAVVARGGSNAVSMGLSDRQILTRIGIQQWRVNPWLGSGGGTFENFARLLRPASWPVALEDTDPIYAHNEYAQLAGEYGSVGLILVLVLAAYLVYRFTKIVKTSLVPRRNSDLVFRNTLFNACGIAVLSGTIFHCFFDFPLRMFSNVLVLGFILGLCLSNKYSGMEFTRSSKLRSFSIYHFPILLCLSMVGFFQSKWLYAEILSERAQKAGVGLVEQSSLYRKAEILDPILRTYPLSLGLTYAEYARKIGVGSGAGRSFAIKALEAFRKSVELDKSYYPSLEALAICLDELGEFKEAEKIHQRALALAPNHRRAHVNYALHLHAIASSSKNAGDRERAGSYYKFVYAKHRGSGDGRLVKGWALFTEGK